MFTVFDTSDKEDTEEEVKVEKPETVVKNEAIETKTDEEPESDVVMYQDEDGYFGI